MRHCWRVTPAVQAAVDEGEGEVDGDRTPDADVGVDHPVLHDQRGLEQSNVDQHPEDGRADHPVVGGLAVCERDVAIVDPEHAEVDQRA